MEALNISEFYSQNGNPNFEIAIKESFEDFVVKEITESGEICDYQPIFNFEKYLEADDLFKNLPKVKDLTKEERSSLYKKLEYYPFNALKTIDGVITPLSHDIDVFTFTVVKSNLNSNEVTHILSKRLAIPYHNIDYSGSKDRHAITFQKFSVLCSFQKIFSYACSLCKYCNHFTLDQSLSQENDEIIDKMEKLMDINFSEYDDRIYICNIKKGNKLKMGSHQGNFFEIVIKNIDEITQIPDKFINYYGLQRFGNNKNNHIIGKLLVDEEFDQALNFIGQYSNFKSVKEIINNKSDKMSSKKIISRLDRKEIMMYYHAYQSFYFNETASKRCKDRQVKDDDWIKHNGKYCRVKNIDESVFFEDIFIDLITKKNKFMKGDKRKLIETISNFKSLPIESGVKVKFQLNKSAYATMALREIYYLNYQ